MLKTQITLRLIAKPHLPIEAETITPDSFQGKSQREIIELPLLSGNRKYRIGDFFSVEITEVKQTQGQKEVQEAQLGDAGSLRIVVQGDLGRFKRLGEGMTNGEMIIEGSVGFHTGAQMRGGMLIIKGNAGDWLGAQMEGGKITVEGSAGHFLGAPYRGNTQGMKGGLILVRGNTGQMAGARMRRGLIAIGGNTGDAAGYGMLAGTIIIGRLTGLRVGANMQRGTIILMQKAPLLPTFYYNCTYQPTIWKLLAEDLRHQGFDLPEGYPKAYFKRFSGDANEGGKGEILEWVIPGELSKN